MLNMDVFGDEGGINQLFADIVNMIYEENNIEELILDNGF